jgi:hypothetical protein
LGILFLNTLVVNAASKINKEDVAVCPCFSKTDVMSKIDKTSFDIHRTSSCASTPYIRLNIVDIKATRQGVRPGFTDIDELPYAHFSAQYDTTTDNYECRESDAAWMIPSSEAKACHNLLLEACDKVKSRICPCYSFADLMKLEKSIENSFVNVDSSKTCLNPTENIYGVYKFESNVPTFALDLENNICMDEDKSSTVTVEQGTHCRDLMDDFCREVNIPSDTDKLSTNICTNDVNKSETCAWVASDLRSRCNQIDGTNGKRMFEQCRWTCSKCACEDDVDFRFNNKNFKDCTWARAKGDVCSKRAIREACRNTCANPSTCCMDNKDFKLFPSSTSAKKKFGCKWAKKRKTNFRCKITSIAINCPETCGLCS